jgi:alkylated DNA repair dioxygenase AlkB
VAGLILMNGDLFDNPVIPGLATAADILSPQQEQCLIGEIDGSGLAPFRFQRWTGNRQTCSFGWAYDFQHGGLVRADPFPRWLQAVQHIAAEAAIVPADALVHCLLTRYNPGAGIGWHRDRSVYEHVVGISLGAPATLRFRRRREDGWTRTSIPLVPRSLYHLSGEARHEWEHSIVPMQQTRWSITFRTFAPHGMLDQYRV